MTFANVLFFCIGGVAGCALLVFLVETVVAFWLHESDTTALSARAAAHRPVLVEAAAPKERRADKAA